MKNHITYNTQDKVTLSQPIYKRKIKCVPLIYKTFEL